MRKMRHIDIDKSVIKKIDISKSSTNQPFVICLFRALKVYPNGNGTGEGNSLSLYVILSENQILKTYEKVYVRAKLRVLDQKQSKHLQKPSNFF